MCKSTLCQGSAARAPQIDLADASTLSLEPLAAKMERSEPRAVMALDFHDKAAAAASAIGAKIAAIPVHVAPAALSESQRSRGRCSSCERRAADQGVQSDQSRAPA